MHCLAIPSVDIRSAREEQGATKAKQEIAMQFTQRTGEQMMWYHGLSLLAQTNAFELTTVWPVHASECITGPPLARAPAKDPGSGSQAACLTG